MFSLSLSQTGIKLQNSGRFSKCQTFLEYSITTRLVIVANPAIVINEMSSLWGEFIMRRVQWATPSIRLDRLEFYLVISINNEGKDWSFSAFFFGKRDNNDQSFLLPTTPSYNLTKPFIHNQINFYHQCLQFHSRRLRKILTLMIPFLKYLNCCQKENCISKILKLVIAFPSCKIIQYFAMQFYSFWIYYMLIQHLLIDGEIVSG